MRFLLILLLTTSAALAQSQKAPIVTSTSNWTVLHITASDTVAKPGSEPVAKAKPGKTKPKSTSATTQTTTAKATPDKPTATTAVAAAPKPVIKPSAAKPTAGKAFLETFADNRNGWLVGKRNGFELEIADDNSYYIRSQRPAEASKSLPRPGRSYIKLPDNLNLNRADTFTVSVEMVMPPGISPDGGLLIGVKDTSNYCQFRLLDRTKVALYTRVDGMSQPTYMTGKPTVAKVPIDAKRNTLTIRRTGQELHFYINGQEVEDSPHPFRPFRGNGVGFISYANAVKFQYLTVQVGK
jgi:hypothetical protein